jgi:hypothetical protein
MCRLMQPEGFQVMQKPMTSHIQKANDSLHIDILLSILMHQSLTMPAVLSLSCLLPSLPLFLILHTYL